MTDLNITPIHADSGNALTRRTRTTVSKSAKSLVNQVSASDAQRLETIHSRVLDLSTEKNLGVDATREVSGFLYEVMRMPVIDTPVVSKALADRLHVQYCRIFQMQDIVSTIMSVLAARDDRDSNPGDGELTAVWGSLSVVHETLEDIAGQLDTSVGQLGQVAA